MRCCLLIGLAVCLLLPRVAFAAPIVISPALAAAAAKNEAGTGMCATAVHLTSFNTLTDPNAASFYVGQTPGMNNVDGKISLKVGAVHFHNGDTKALSDFASPQPLPFSSLQGAARPGNDQNIALRTRGYLNVPSPAIYTLGVQADDGYRLLIAGTQIMQSTFTGSSLHDSRQVQFVAAGLYPIELVYFQQTGAAVLGLAKSAQADVEVGSAPAALPASFKLIEATELFPALVGQPSCSECRIDADCGTNSGQYCRDGLCQGCLVSARCGATCMPCPASLPTCGGTQCVECTPEDTHACDARGNLCINNVCTGCTADDQCGTGKTCDTFFGQCISRPNIQYSGGCSASAAAPGSGGPAGLLFVMALLLGVFFFAGRLRTGVVVVAADPKQRRNRSRSRYLARSALLVVVLLAVGIPRAQAQDLSPQRATFNTQTFRPTLGTGNLFTVEGTLMTQAPWPMAALILEFANRPLRLVLQDQGETYAATVPAAFTAHVLAGAGITRWFSAALALPVVMYQGFDNRTPTTDVPNTPSVAGVGDLRLLTKFRLLNKGGFGLAAVPQLTFPTGSATSFRGDDTFGIEPRLAADYRFSNGIFIAINLGVYIRTYNRTVDYDLVRVSDQLRYGVGVGIPLPKGFVISAEATGATSFSKFTGGPLYTPLEWYVGARYAITRGLDLGVGGGGALVGAVGSPNVRLFAGLSYALPARPAPQRTPIEPAPKPLVDNVKPYVPTGPVVPVPGPDADKDGVEDKLDRCPNEPGPGANGGCPDRDQDKDGLVDRLDKCPSQPGPKESAGCPLLDIGEGSITLALPLKFLPGSTELDPSSRPTVAALVTAWRATPTIKKVLIGVAASGYTHHATKKLAGRRAKQLSELLIEAGAPADLLVIRAASEPGADEISRVDLVREAVSVRPEPVRIEPVKPEPAKPEPTKPEPTKPEPVKSEPEKIVPTRHHHRSHSSADDGETEADTKPHHGKRSHRESDGKSKKSNKEKRNRH